MKLSRLSDRQLRRLIRNADVRFGGIYDMPNSDESAENRAMALKARSFEKEFLEIYYTVKSWYLWNWLSRRKHLSMDYAKAWSEYGKFADSLGKAQIAFFNMRKLLDKIAENK